MSDFLVIIAICCGISFLGSLQLGPVNYQVLKYSTQDARNNAFMAAIGGSLPEFLYGFLAVMGGMYLLEQPLIRITIQWSTVYMLAAIGVYHLFKRSKPSTEKKIKSNRNAFLLGFSLAMLNPQLLLFWFTIYTTLIAPSYHAPLIVVATSVGLGATAGAFLLLTLFALIGGFFKTRLHKIIQHPMSHIVIGILFLFLASYQFIALC